MKKLFAFISVLALAATAIFADVSVKNLGNGSFEVTFFYGNPRASEVVVAGDFTNWQNGAEPMTKTDKGWTYTKIVPAGTIMKYKFISDGNWTADIKAPDTVDDGFGGKNGLVDVDALGGDAAGTVKYPNVKFMSWSMIGMQTKFSTQKSDDKTSKETKAESVALGFKSYDKLTGDLTGNMPFYIELAVSEQDYEDANVKIYDRNNNFDDNLDLLKKCVGNLASNPVSYLANSSTDWSSNPKLGHLKFGWNTPFVNYTAGYVYAKMPMRQAITWSTVADNWDAGYEHNGGFSQFDNGEKLSKIGDMSVNFGFNLNKSADRKGNNYGSMAYGTLDTGAWKIDAQWNAMYGKDFLFYEPVENDLILGAKGKIADISLAAQGLLAIHNKSTEDILGTDYAHAGDWWKAADYFGYSTDIFYRNSGVDGIENIAANIRAGYKADMFSIDAEYRMRGAEASMLYIRNNHDDNDLRLKDMLGAPNSQKATLTFGVNPIEELNIGLKASVESELKHYNSTDEVVKGLSHCWASGYAGNSYLPVLFDKAGGFELEFDPSVTYSLSENSSINAYGILKAANYRVLGAAKDYEYSASDSSFLFKYAGASYKASINDTVKNLEIYYGLDNSNAALLGNSLVAKVGLPSDVEVSGGILVRSVKNTTAGDAYVKDELNPFGFGIGVSKKLQSIKKPVVFAQFVWNMDMYKGFGDGQQNLNLKNGANIGDWGYTGAVARYDGAGAMRVGMSWDF